jgi:ABC-type transport system involved in multi-copper enzyme maturation permease subunit
MKWLFWKEYRQNWLVVVALLIFVVVPYPFGLFAIYETPNRHAWPGIVLIASLWSFIITQVALAVAGGNAIAGERVDRSAEFQCILPFTRRKILSAKLLFSLAIAAAIWLINPPIIWCMAKVDSTVLASGPSLLFINALLTGLVFFSVGWLFSSFLFSPTFATCAGLIAPAILVSMIGFVAYLVRILIDPQIDNRGVEYFFLIAYAGACLITASISFGIGTWLYLRRVEP